MECQPEVVPNAVLDENVDVFLVRKYFTNDAWLLVTEAKEKVSCLDLSRLSA